MKSWAKKSASAHEPRKEDGKNDMEPTNQLGTTLSLSSGPLPPDWKSLWCIKGKLLLSSINAIFLMAVYVLHPTLMRKIKNDKNWIF